MTITLTTSGANRTVTISYTAPAAVMDAILEGAAHRLVTVAHLGPDKAYANFTTAEKLSVLDTFVSASVVNEAKADSVTTATEAARAAAQAAADTSMSLP